jgi:Ca-activated chloride channel family protein
MADPCGMKIDCRLDYETVLSGKAEVVHLAIVFQAEPQASGRETPFAFGLVIDNSGSMQGAPLEHAKAAAVMVLKNLRANDRLSVVVFSSSAQTIIPLQLPADKARLQADIEKIHPEGSTNLTAGWMLGRDELKKAPADLPRKLLLLTDGHLNHGITEPPVVRQIVEQGLEMDRVRTTCLGFGDEYEEDLLDSLAKAGSGMLHDADSPESLPGIFRQELEALLAISTQNLRVRVRKLHYCSGLALLSEYPVVALPEGGVEITVGDLVSEEQRVLVLALEVLPIPPLADGSAAASIEGEALLDLELAYDEITESGITSKVEQRTVRLSAVQDPADVRVSEQVVAWVTAQEVGRAIAEAIKDRDRGDLDAYQARLQTLRERLARYGCPSGTRKALEDLAAFEAASVDWDAGTRKSSRAYSTQSLRASSYYAAKLREPKPPRPPSPPSPPSDPSPGSATPGEGAK